MCRPENRAASHIRLVQLSFRACADLQWTDQSFCSVLFELGTVHDRH
jgi:hypothetical protein